MSENMLVSAIKPENKIENRAFHKHETGISQSNNFSEKILFLQRAIGNHAVERLFRSGVLQAKGTAGQTPEVPPQKEANINSLKGGGHPLPESTGAFFEPRLGTNFSRGRVHSGAVAGQSARDVNAHAYTMGHDIVFGVSRFAPGTNEGRRLLAHELTNVVQRTALDIDKISSDSQNPAMTVPIFMIPVSRTLLFLVYSGHASGDIAKAADYPTTFTMPADKTKRVATPPKADAKPPISNIPVEAHFFPTVALAKGRALVIGGFHGDEQPGWQATDALVSELSQSKGSFELAFNTIIVPRLNAGAITDELAGVRLWRNRCNRQLVDLNRNFPTGNKPKDTDCVNTKGAPIQPEVLAVMDIITKFKPDRIVSMHAITNPKSAGIFADPNQDPQAIELARGMASTVVNASDRRKNRLGPGATDFNPVYPGDKPGVVGAGTSLGAWAPTAIPGQTTTVITTEAPGFAPLGTGSGSASRTVEGLVRPLRAFLGDPNNLATAADRDILADIDAFNVADQLAFLTGLLPRKNEIFDRIKLRIDTAVETLKTKNPPKSITLNVLSGLRLFSEKVPGSTPQAQIDFEKFFLTGGKSKGWDTLPDRFFQKGKRSNGVDRAKWLATSSKDRLNIILQFSSLPGASRHHWGTEVDFNSTDVADWQKAAGGKPDGKFFVLGQWLQTTAPSVGLMQSFTPGRTGGYNEEPWHYSYAPIALGLRTRYNKQVNLQTDVIDKIEAEFQKRAKAAGKTIPSDFGAALKQINVSDLVNNIGPGL